MNRHPDWLAADWCASGVGALMTTRRGGCSDAPFDAMNLQVGGGDAADRVGANRALLAAATGATPVYLQQVHGARVVRLGAAHAVRSAPVEVADACVTTEPGLACTVLVADCLPVLFAAPAGRGVAAAHAGWRGLAGGVLEATVVALCEATGCAPQEVQAWMGAAIGPAHFQVGGDVLEAFGGTGSGGGAGARTQYGDGGGAAPSESTGSGARTAPGASEPHRDGMRAGPPRGAESFLRTWPDAPPGFQPERSGKWLADLPFLARRRLAAAGVTAVFGGTWCTVAEPSRFFSFRRDRVTGRMAAAVWVLPRAR